MIEAMSYSTPVICLDLSGPRDMVTDDSGIRVKANSVNQVILDISSGLSRLYCDRDYFQKLSRNSYLRVKNSYSWEKRAKELNKVYKEILDEI